MEETNTRTCIKCGEVRPETSFAPVYREGQVRYRRRACKICLYDANSARWKRSNAKNAHKHVGLYRSDPEYRKAALKRQKKYSQTEQGKAKKRIRDRLYDQQRRITENATPITTKVTRQSWERKLPQFGDRCHWCGKRMKGKATMDHVVPLSRGGAHSLENIVAACSTCNSSKNNKLPHEWSLRLL